MRISEILTEEQLDEIDRRGFLRGLGAAAFGAATLGAMGGAHARVVPGQGDDSNINRLTGKPNVVQVAPDEKPSAPMPNQSVDSAEKVEKTADGIIVHYGGKTYKGIEVPKGSPTPRGAKMIKIHQAQMGERGIGNYTTYLLPNGSAVIYK